ncbi:DASH family cryptochrome [Pedobacter aquatilis]|uniref:DASH family cryptochrome n=1 Tax=Pedobacter aquatilis TaxID=351343 RepID=UPI00292E0610|nr:DASH family cryptochrome [Pedobacter aquatilis]
MAKRGLVWFKNDLRLHDNETLIIANKECKELIFCYCIERMRFKMLDHGFTKMDALRLKFLEQSLIDLQKQLKKAGGHLIIGEKSALDTLPELIAKYEITDIYAEEEYASEELSLIEEVKELLPKINFHFSWGKTLYHKDDLPFKIAKIPLTSKAFRIPLSKKATPRDTFDPPKKLKSIKGIKSTPFPDCSIYGFDKKAYKKLRSLVSGGETEALKRLEYYTFKSELLTGYRWSRNQSQGLDYSSKFSPYLALGCISPRTIYHKIKAYEDEVKKNQSTWWLVFELVWRDYFTFKAMRFGNKIFASQGFKNKPVQWAHDNKSFERWKEGKTGIPFVDAHMRQLNQTGYMSNRGRVNCASYLTHDLKIDWRWGAAYFESKLIDYDVSSNWMNWHMQAFEIYYTNPVHQSNKYKAQDFIREWIPELKKANNTEVLIPWEFNVKAYPKPIEIYEKWGRAIGLIKKLKP